MADVIPSNRTANLEQSAALLESGEPNSPMHACAREHSSDAGFKAPRRGRAAWWMALSGSPPFVAVVQSTDLR